MIRRFIRWIRYMREPEYDDPKAQRWITLLKKRARSTGQLPDAEVLQKTGMHAGHWFWKEDNAIPSEGFAVNVCLAVAKVQTVVGPIDLDLVGRDDFGRRVKYLPLGKTGRGIWFGIDEEVFDCGIATARAPLEDVVWAGLVALRELNEVRQADESTNADEREDLMEKTLRRIVWFPSVKAWLFMLSNNEGELESCVDLE